MNAIIHNASRNTQNAAEDIAKTGYHEPHLILGTVGRINLISPDDGKTVLQTIDMIAKKKEAWAEVLQKLSEMGVDTSLPFMQKPFECSINDNVGIKWDKEGVTVSAWVYQFTGNEAGWELGGDGIIHISILQHAEHHINFNICSHYQRSWLRNPEINEYNFANGEYSGINYFVVNDPNYTSLDAWKSHLADLASKGTPMTLIYQLKDPLRINFHSGSELNLNFSNVHPESLIALDDIDGNRMTRIDVTYRDEADGRYRDTDIRWSEEWLAAHPGQFPQSIQTIMAGLGWKADYPALYKLYMKVMQLESKVNNL